MATFRRAVTPEATYFFTVNILLTLNNVKPNDDLMPVDNLCGTVKMINGAELVERWDALRLSSPTRYKL